MKIDYTPGVNPKVAFSSFDKHMALRTDSRKTFCRFEGLKVMSFKAFKDCCIARQESNAKHRHTSNQRKSFECENCACGLEILTGRRLKLPVNVRVIK